MRTPDPTRLTRRQLLGQTALGAAALVAGGARPARAQGPKPGGATVWAQEIAVTSLHPIT